MNRKTLTQLDKVDQVVTTMSLEDMEPTDRMKKDLIRVATGRKTPEQLLSEIKKRYTNE